MKKKEEKTKTIILELADIRKTLLDSLARLKGGGIDEERRATAVTQ